jgi:hypothetical protein
LNQGKPGLNPILSVNRTGLQQPQVFRPIRNRYADLTGGQVPFGSFKGFVCYPANLYFCKYSANPVFRKRTGVAGLAIGVKFVCIEAWATDYLPQS